MTDGIIQEVIDNYMINHNISPSSLNGLKQELIEKIKQSIEKDFIWHYSKDGERCYEKEILTKIIGDNQK